MPHSLSSHARECYFYTTAITNHTLIFDALIFTTAAFPVLDGAEDALAKEPPLLGLEGAVVDGLGLFNLAEGP